MTLEEFVKKYNNKGIDYDGNFGDQCVDLYRQYVKEVLQYPQSPPVVGAKDIWDTYLPEYFRRIDNTPYGVPSEGDIVIFSMGKFGHVSIFLEGNASRFTSFDQNYPLGSKCHKQGHTYSAVIGWLTPIKEDNMDIPDFFKVLLQESNLSLDREGEFRSYWEKAKKYDEDTNTLKEQVKSANEALADRAREVSMLIEKNQKLSDAKEESEELYNKTKSELSEKAWEAEKLEIENITLKEEIVKLENKITKLSSKHPLDDFTIWYHVWYKIMSRR